MSGKLDRLNFFEALLNRATWKAAINIATYGDDGSHKITTQMKNLFVFGHGLSQKYAIEQEDTDGDRLIEFTVGMIEEVSSGKIPS